MNEVVIVSYGRTPIGSFGGLLLPFSAVQLGSHVIKGTLNKIDLDSQTVDEVYFGNVVSANLGQAPARQAAIGAGIGEHVPCTTINKVCSSGMKALMIGASSIMLGQNDVVITGGMESMSNIPFYAPNQRFGTKFGHTQLIDGLQKDGLWEVYNEFMMGNCADITADEMNISRADQDEYAIRSYTLTKSSTEAGFFKDEILPITIPQRKKEDLTMAIDQEFSQVNFEKLKNLKPAFKKDGTVTAGNASTINDGAACVILMSAEKAKDLGLTPIAKIKGFADAAQDPIHFTTAPSLAIPKAMKKAGIEQKDVDFFEINEAFSAVALANQKKLAIEIDKINVFGGAVAMGHPLGASGARIVCTLNSILQQKDATLGVAGICNGGGGASAIIIERLS